MSVTIRLEDDIDISRGDMICRPHNQPTVAQRARRDGLLDDRRAAARRAGATRIKHTTRTARAIVDELRYRIDVNTLHRDEAADELGLNEIGRVRLRTSAPLLRRRVPPQPRDRQLHPDRRGDQRHRRRRHDLRTLTPAPNRC